MLDLKQIELNKDIKSNALWVVEQIPGYIGSGDVTPILREGKKPAITVDSDEDAEQEPES